jgi:hypothetical protein
MDTLLVAIVWEQVLASGVIGGGLAVVAVGCMALFQKRPPAAVEAQPADPAPQPGVSKPVALLLILAGLGVAAAGILWRTSFFS